MPLKSSVLPKSSEKPSLSASSLANYKRDSYNGYGNGLAKAFELTMTPALFGGIGFLIDRKADTKPWFTVGLMVFAIVGMFVRMWYGYDNEMKAHEKKMVRSGPANATELRSPSSTVSSNATRPTDADRVTLPTGVTLDTDPSELFHATDASTNGSAGR